MEMESVVYSIDVSDLFPSSMLAAYVLQLHL